MRKYFVGMGSQNEIVSENENARGEDIRIEMHEDTVDDVDDDETVRGGDNFETSMHQSVYHADHHH